MPTWEPGTWRPRSSQYPTFRVIFSYDSYSNSGNQITFNNLRVYFPISGNTSYAGNQYATVTGYFNGEQIFQGSKNMDISANGQSIGGVTLTRTYTSTTCTFRVTGGRAVSGGGTFDWTWNIAVPAPFQNPTWSGQDIWASDYDVATGTASGSGNTVYWKCNASWNSSTSNDNGIGPYRENPQEGIPGYTLNKPTSVNTSARVTGYKVGQNQITLYLRYRDVNNNMSVNAIASKAITVHEYKIPSISASQTVPSTMIAGTSSLAVPLNVTKWDMGDDISDKYFCHFTRNVIRNGEANSNNIQVFDTTKSTGSRTTTFNTGLSDLKPNDQFRVMLEKSYEKSDGTTGYNTILNNLVTVIHRETTAPQSLTYSPTNMVEGYTYKLKIDWTAPSDWGTRSGDRMINLNYVLGTSSSYDVVANDTGTQYHEVVNFTPPITGSDKSTTYYVNAYAYVASPTNKSSTVRINLPVAARIKPTCSGISLATAAVTTKNSPQFIMTDTPSWGNTQAPDTKLTTYDLYIDGTYDSSHYVKPGESKTFSAAGQYGWGAHTAYVKVTVSTDIGSNTYTSNTVNLEIGDYPLYPTVNIRPYSHQAGQSRTFTWTISSNDWNLSQGRLFTYRILVDGVQKESGTKPANTTSISYTQIYSEACDVVLYIKQTNSLGHSDEVSSTGIISDPTPPTKADIIFNPIPIALPIQEPVIVITRNDNGTYAQSSATIKVELLNASNTVIATPVAQTNISMTATTYALPATNLSAYTSGEFKYRVTYRKVYTTGLVTTTTYLQQIVPPIVEITDKSYITSDCVLHIKFEIKNTYHASLPYWIEYSTDYKQTWTRLDNVMSYDLQSDYLDEIYIRAYGCNPVDELLTEWLCHEIPSQYHLKGSKSGSAMQILRRIRASHDGNELRKVKRIKKVQ